ncbi:hypothetical protein F383_03480 [Gossypium arboreum]|uniref:Uncharacterized protein n=1 Tax=Gossypium arboreum TaxID=29729 RepID=A0A0B0P5Q8_GOSAR|nr:hypothetical protein F383_03480 [Gossypium arboreum]
MDQSAFFE